MKSLFPGIAAAFLVSSLASNASADPTDRIAVRLEYETPADAGCPTAESFALVLSGEFGYLMVRPDVAAVLRVQIKRVGKAFQAETWAPDVTGAEEKWHGETEKRTTCRELAYDLAYMIRLRLGPDAWPSETAPASLAAPPEIEVGRVEIDPIEPRLYAPVLGPIVGAPLKKVLTLPVRPSVPFWLSVTFAAMVMPYGLSSPAVGGGASVWVRWSWFGVGGEMRGFTTPSSGIGPRSVPGTTSVYTGAVHPCLLVRFLDICGTATLSNFAFDVEPPADTGQIDGVSAGFGARLAARWQIDPLFALVGFGEATAELRRFNFFSLPTGNQTAPIFEWRSPTPRVLFGVGLALTVF